MPLLRRSKVPVINLGEIEAQIDTLLSNPSITTEQITHLNEARESIDRARSLQQAGIPLTSVPVSIAITTIGIVKRQLGLEPPLRR